MDRFWTRLLLHPLRNCRILAALRSTRQGQHSADCRLRLRYDATIKTRADAHGGRLMSFYRGMTCENVTLKGDQGTPITAYVAKPSGPGPFPGVVLVHHLPGWSELYIETTRRFAHHGYLAICANLYERPGEGNPDYVPPKARADGPLPPAHIICHTQA